MWFADSKLAVLSLQYQKEGGLYAILKQDEKGSSNYLLTSIQVKKFYQKFQLKKFEFLSDFFEISLTGEIFLKDELGTPQFC